MFPTPSLKTSHAQTNSWSYVHGGVDLADGFVVRWELVYLHAVAHQLAHDLDFELVQLTLGDGVRFGDNGDDVDLRGVGEKFNRTQKGQPNRSNAEDQPTLETN